MNETRYKMVPRRKASRFSRAAGTAYLAVVPLILWLNWGEFTSLPTWMWLWLLLLLVGDWLRTSVLVLRGDEDYL